MQFNTTWYDRFREIAVTDIDDLIVGNTYYSNSYPEKFVLRGLMTNAEAYARKGIKWSYPSSADDIEWFETETGRTHSLRDRGVTPNPYNPWLIFRTEEERDACELMLGVML